MLSKSTCAGHGNCRFTGTWDVTMAEDDAQKIFHLPPTERLLLLEREAYYYNRQPKHALLPECTSLHPATEC